MDFPKVVEDMIRDGILPEEDLKKLAQVRRDATAALCTSPEAFSQFAKDCIESGSDWEDNTFGKIARYIDGELGEIDSEDKAELEKEASPLKALQTTLAGIGALGIAAIPAQRAMAQIKQNKDINSSWHSLIKNDADIAANPNTPANWSILEDYAPGIAANPHAAKAYIKTMNEYGSASPALIKDLVTVGKGLDERQPGFGGPGDITKNVGGVIKSLDVIGDN